MAWTVPRTWTADTLVGATDLNTDLRDQLVALKAPPFYQLITASALSLSASASTAVPIGTISGTITTYGGDIEVYFKGKVDATNHVMNIEYDGTAVSSRPSGLGNYISEYCELHLWVTGLPSGAHTFRPTWYNPAGNWIALLWSAQPVVFWARET